MRSTADSLQATPRVAGLSEQEIGASEPLADLRAPCAPTADAAGS